MGERCVCLCERCDCLCDRCVNVCKIERYVVSMNDMLIFVSFV